MELMYYVYAYLRKDGSGNKGKPNSEIQKLKKSQVMSGRKQSAEVIAKRTSANIVNKWWSFNNISMKSREFPGEEWILGRSAIKKDLL